MKNLGNQIVENVKVGMRLKFYGEKKYYKVRATNACFSVCTKPFNLNHTFLYTVIDWEKGVRGAENLVFGMGAETDEQCQEMLNRFTEGESELSYSNRCRLEIEKSIT